MSQCPGEQFLFSASHRADRRVKPRNLNTAQQIQLQGVISEEDGTNLYGGGGLKSHFMLCANCNQCMIELVYESKKASLWLQVYSQKKQPLLIMPNFNKPAKSSFKDSEHCDMVLLSFAQNVKSKVVKNVFFTIFPVHLWVSFPFNPDGSYSVNER